MMHYKRIEVDGMLNIIQGQQLYQHLRHFVLLRMMVGKKVFNLLQNVFLFRIMNHHKMNAIVQDAHRADVVHLAFITNFLAVHTAFDKLASTHTQCFHRV